MRKKRLEEARMLSWQNLGKHITFFLPGLFRLNGYTGRYPALSITGSACDLNCPHCGGKILKPMVASPSPQKLVEQCKQLDREGQLGVLISGGCRSDGTLPWSEYLQAIEGIKRQTGLFVSMHCGLLDAKTALRLKEAGVDQALIDVVGDDNTFLRVYGLSSGVERTTRTLEALEKAELPVVPHIVCGIDYGRIIGEYNAIEIISRFKIDQLVVVELMRLPHTPMANAPAPGAEQVADIIAQARIRLPHIPISLGCARRRGNRYLEVLAIEAGVNRMALPSEEAVTCAEAYGLDIDYQPTCCSAIIRYTTEGWL